MQQLFRLLVFFKSALRVSGNRFAHHQEHFLTICSFWYSIPTLLPTGATVEMELTRGPIRQQCRCIVPKAVYAVKKCSWGWANLSPETCRADFKKTNKRKSWCISLVAYIVVLVMQVTQTSNAWSVSVFWCWVVGIHNFSEILVATWLVAVVAVFNIANADISALLGDYAASSANSLRGSLK